MRSRGQRGFTLVELIIALSIVAALLVVAFGGLRVAIAAWSQGEDRAEAHAHLRGVAVTLSRAVGATYPYRASLDLSPDAVLLFRGTENRLEFATQTPPFPHPVPVAFTAVVLAIEDDNGPALVIRERVLPNREPFTSAAVVLRDPTIRQIAFRYLTDGGSWQDTWDAEAENGLPRGVEMTLSILRQGRVETMPPLTVAIRAATQ
jgi:general secretion pathway protein J